MIASQRLILRPTSFDDTSFLLELLNSEKWINNIGDRKVKNDDQAIEFIKKVRSHLNPSEGMGQHIIQIKETKEKVGIVGIFRRDGLDYPDIGFALLERFEKNGYALEASEALLKNFISIKAYPQILAITLPTNLASQKLLEKIGLEYDKMIQLPNDQDQLMLYSMKIDKSN